MVDETVPAGLGRRAAALLLEVPLYLVTLCIGWYVWLLLTSRRGTTPAKGMLGLVIVDARSGKVASAGRVWFREVVFKGILPCVLALATQPLLGTGIASAIPAIYLLTGLLYPSVAQGDRTTWDYLAGTEVRRQITINQPLTQSDFRRIDDAMPSRNSFVR